MATRPIPSLEIEDPSGRRVTVAQASSDDRLGDLADILGLDPRSPLRVDGRPAARHESLARAGLRRGSTLGAATRPGEVQHGSLGPDAEPVVTVVCEAGPGAGAVTLLPPGRTIIGRSPTAGVVVADAAVEPHHALVDVAADGTAELVQLAGRVPCRVAGQPLTGRGGIPDGGVIALGASRLRVALAAGAAPGGATLTPVPGDPWRRTLRRTPRVVPRWDPQPVEIPAAGSRQLRPSATGILAGLLTACATAVVAVVMRSPMFLVFAGVSLVAAVGMWAAGTIGAARDGRRWRATRDRDVASFAAAIERQREARWRHHVTTTPGLAEAIAAASTVRGDVWARRPGHDDAFRVGLGWGPVEWTVAVAVAPGAAGEALPPELAGIVAAAARFDDAPVPADLGPGAALAVAGPDAVAVARAAVVQLATWVGPADLHLVVIVDEPDRWDWCRWLPHTTGPDGPAVVAADEPDTVAAALAGAGDTDGRHVVVVTDRADLLALRTGTLRRFLGSPAAPAVVVVLGPGVTPPALCRSVLEVGSIGVGRWWADASVDAHPVMVHAAGVTATTAAAVARTLAGLSDPEDAAGGSGALATDVGLGALNAEHGTGPIDDAIAVAAAWRSGGSDPAPLAILGAAVDGIVEIDLARDGPHALVAGTTGSGKSELLRTLVVSLATRCSPDHLTFVLVDYKGGSTFDACADLPHTVGVVTDLDDRLAERALTSLEAEVRRRERVLRAYGAVDLADYRADAEREPLPRLVVVVDEFAALAADLPGFLDALVGIAQRGRSLGMHLVLATQRPGGVVSDDIRANTNLRIALRLQDVADARDVVGDDAPAAFPRRAPGRTMLRLGPDEHVLFQAARSSGPARPPDGARLHVVGGALATAPDGAAAETELTVLVRSIRNAAALCDVRPPHRPWLPALPTSLGIDGVDEVDDRALGVAAVGVVDVPAEQRCHPLCWSPADGNLAIVGAGGSGTTTALRSVLLAACASRSPAQLHVYVVDARGDDRLDALGALDHCAGIVRPHERERLSRLLRRLTADLDARRACGGGDGHPGVVLAVDGMPALRAVLDDPLDTVDHDALHRIVTDGSAVGIAAVMTADRPGAMPAALLAACPERWVLHVDDPAEAAMCGVPAAIVPGPVPGRLVVASTRHEAQVADLAPLLARVPGGPGGPAPVGVLPARVDANALRATSRAAGGELSLVVGAAFDTLAPAVLTIPDGEHVLVLGPARSGRTTALARLAEAWRDARPDGQVAVIAPRSGTAWVDGPTPVGLAAALGAVRDDGTGSPVLVVIDDAERVEDPAGRLAALVAERRPGVLVVAAGRPDALRPMFGHWTSVVRRSRIGVLLAACADVDGDLLGELLPRRRPLPPRPGLAWLVDGAGRRLVQVAT